MFRRIQTITRAGWQRLPVKLRVNVARSVQPKFTVSTTAIIVNDENKVLLLEHVLRPGSGWALPGGFLNHFEQPHEGLRREMREEIGLELDDVKPYYARTHHTHVEIFYTCRPATEPHVASREIMDLRWFSADELPKDLSATQAGLIVEVLRTRPVKA